MEGKSTEHNGNHDIKIPVIDLPNTDIDEATGFALVDACAKYGFVFVKGKGLGFTADVLDNTFELSKTFFGSPETEKQKCAIQANNVGWSAMHSETLDPEHQKRGDFKEAINFGEFKHGNAQQSLSPSLKPHEKDIAHFEKLCHDLCIKLLRLFALGLKIDPQEGGADWFASRHDPSQGTSGSVLRWLYYPVIPPTSSTFDNVADIRAGAHSDYGSLTLLFQRSTQSGLEILTPTSTWAPVPVNPPGTASDPYPPILVNVGDLMQFWTKGLLKSTVHRVVFPEGEGRDRYSIAYFCHPLDQVRIEDVPSEVVRERGASEGAGGEGGEIITAKGYLQKRLAETYNWGKEQSPARD